MTGLRTLLLVLLLLPLAAAAQPAPVAIEGLIDLSQWDFEKDGNVQLRGEYEFYWGRYLNRRELLIEQPEHFAEVPQPWTTATTEVEGQGFATYRLNVLIPPGQESLSLKILEIGTAARIFIDGELKAQIGHPGTQPQSTEGAYRPIVLDFKPAGQRVELVFHVANFDHRVGGIWERVHLGTNRNIHRLSDREVALDLLLSGALLMIAIFNLTLFLLQREQRASLFLALFCLTAALRIVSINEDYLLRLFPAMEWGLFTKVEYISWFLLLPSFAHYLKSVFPDEVDNRALYAADGISAVVILMTLVTPLAIYSYTAPVMQLFHFIALSYGTWCMLQARRHRRHGANLLLAGYSIMFLLTLNDLLVAAYFIDAPSVIGIGLIAFTICQSLLASWDFAHSTRLVVNQHEQLQTTSLKLKTQEKLRQEAEEQSKQTSVRSQQSQQFEALGILAHGVVSDLKESLELASHEVEQLTTAIEQSNPELLESVRKTQQTADRSMAVIEDLLSLSAFDSARQQTPVNVVIAELISNTKMAAVLEQYNINLETHFQESVQPVRGSRLHIQRILENLINNAVNSQPDGGAITITTEQVYTDGRTLFYDTLQAGYYVVMSVEDQGTGIDPDDLDSIFQPFFSSQEDSRTGLGMSVVRAIIRQLQGGIDVISELGNGTRFDIYLPVAID